MRTATPLLTDLLKAVSRSFYLTLRVLPAAVRPQIGLAYLLARTTDTIADTELVPVPDRLTALDDLRQSIAGHRQTPVAFHALALAQPAAPGGGTNAERILLERAAEIVSLLDNFTAADQRLIRDVLSVITSGQQLDLERFGAASPGRLVALNTATELDDYTYRVAGCVGEFWTRICRAHLFPRADLDEASLLRDGVRFGKGLQLVNILRDLPKDLRMGRCYLPSAQLAQAGLAPGDLLDPANYSRLRPVYEALLDQSKAHLQAGWDYTNTLPRSCIRVRLACAWPVLLGVRTLARLRVENPLNADRRIKVTRAEVRQIMLATVVHYPFPGAWRGLFEQAGQIPR